MNQPSKNGISQLLHALAQSGDKWVQLCVLILVGISGLGNWFATQNSTSATIQGQDKIRDEMRQKLDQIHQWVRDDIHNEVDAYEKRQRNGLEKLDQSLQNQQQILKNETAILEEIHKRQP